MGCEVKPPFNREQQESTIKTELRKTDRLLAINEISTVCDFFPLKTHIYLKMKQAEGQPRTEGCESQPLRHAALLAVCAVDCNYLMFALHRYKWASMQACL